MDSLINLISNTPDYRYNLHSHTEFCDARAPMSVIAQHAVQAGFLLWGFSPHSPIPTGNDPLARHIPIPSQCNMKLTDVPTYIQEVDRLKALHEPEMTILRGMEIDYFSPDWGAHIDLFQRMPLHYRIGSVHFVPNQEGYYVDCDGSAARFADYLRQHYAGDLRYVVEHYFEQVLTMIERGGFDILAHFDKIIANASAIDPTLEDQPWYAALITDVIRQASDRDLIIEINTKSLADRHRFFPATRWWPLLPSGGIVINSDTHYPDRTNAGRPEAIAALPRTSRF